MCTVKDIQNLTKRLTDSSNAYGMETHADKSKVIIIGKVKAKIYINELWFEKVNSFKYLGATIFKNGSTMTYPP